MRAVSISVIALLLLALSAPSSAQGPARKKPPVSKGPISKPPTEWTGGSVTEVAGRTLEQWKARLKGGDSSLRAEAIMAIAGFGDSAASCALLLVDRTKDQDPSPKVKAIMALRMIPVYEQDIPKIVRALAARITYPEERESIVRYEAIRTLSERFSADTPEIIPSLVKATVDPSFEIRHLAIGVLVRAGQSKDGPDSRAVSALIRRIGNEKTFHVRLEAIQGLGALGRPADPKLAQAVRVALYQPITAIPPNGTLVIWSHASLVAVETGGVDVKTDPHLRKITAYLKHKDHHLRSQAARALGALGPKAKTQVPALIEMTESAEPLDVQGACAALGGIGDNSDRVVNALVAVLTHRDKATVITALSALMQLKAGGVRVLAAIQKELDRGPRDKVLEPYFKHTIEELKKPVKVQKKK